MTLNARSTRTIALRLIVGLALLGWPRVGAAQGTWSAISPPPPPPSPHKPGEVFSPNALAVDTAGNLYVADNDGVYPNHIGDGSRIQKRDAQGNWSVIATYGTALGQVADTSALAVDAAGSLYVAELRAGGGRIQKRDAQGNWSILAPGGDALGQLHHPTALAVDGGGTLYVAEDVNNRIQKRDAQGNWSVIATQGSAVGQVQFARYGGALAVDTAGNLYVEDGYDPFRIQKRDTQGNWSVIATQGAGALAPDAAGNLYATANGQIQERDAQGNWSVMATYGAGLGQVDWPTAVAVGAAGDLYVADSGGNEGRIQKRDAQGSWSVLATDGWEPGQASAPSALAIDAAGGLYVADSANGADRIQKRDPQGNWSVLATFGDALGQVDELSALAADSAGNLYAADGYYYQWATPSGLSGRIQKRDAQGNWSLIATAGHALGQVHWPKALAEDAGGNLYVAERGGWDGDTYYPGRIQKRDAQGNWSLIADEAGDLGQITGWVAALATDTAGNLYVAENWVENSDFYHAGIQKRDVQGRWLAIEDPPPDIDVALAADAAGNLYVASRSAGSCPSSEIQKRDAQGNWSLIDGPYSFPEGLAADAVGNLDVADTDNNRVLKYRPAP